MNFPFYIARRYLFSKKSHNAINVISLVSVCGVMVATVALVCTLSVYNGFEDLAASFFSHFDPELKITSRYGKVFNPSDERIQEIRRHPAVELSSEVLEDNALVKYRERQVVGVTVKGVDEDFPRLVQIDSVLIDGRFVLEEDVVNYATLGIGLASSLGINAGFVYPLEVYAPKRNETVNMANLTASFRVEYAYIGGVYRVNESNYDENYMIVSLPLARSLFHYENEISALEIKMKPDAQQAQVEKDFRSILGDDFVVQNRFEQHEASFRIMQVEKWVTFLILCFILAIALFNIVGSLSMLMVEKKNDVRTLRNMGAENSQIRHIFLLEGWMISGFGGFIGIIIGVVLCLLQQKYGLIPLGDTAGAFVIEAYPVRVVATDVLAVLLTVLCIGFLAAWYPSHYLGKKWLK